MEKYARQNYVEEHHASMHKKTAIKRCSRENKLWKFEGKFFPTTNMISCTCLEHKSGAMKSRRRHMLLIRIYTFVGIADPWKKSLPPLWVEVMFSWGIAHPRKASPLQQTPGRGEGKTGLFPHRPPPPAIHPLHLPSSPLELGRVGVAVFTRQGIERWASMPTWTSTLVGSSLTTHLPFPTPLPYRQVYIRFMILISNTKNEKVENRKGQISNWGKGLFEISLTP